LAKSQLNVSIVNIHQKKLEISQEKIKDLAPLNQIKVLSFKEKGEWTLESKYNIGRKKQEGE